MKRKGEGNLPLYQYHNPLERANMEGKISRKSRRECKEDIRGREKRLLFWENCRHAFSRPEEGEKEKGEFWQRTKKKKKTAVEGGGVTSCKQVTEL